MSNHQKGYYRDNQIRVSVEDYELLDTEQIVMMHFMGLKYGRRIAQKRLSSLCKRGLLKRGRLSMDHSYHYFMGRRPGQPEHKLGVNWVRLWLMANFKSWEQMHSFEYEVDYKILRCDGFAAIKNTWTGAFKFYFIEFDNHLSGNAFDKVEKYNKLYEQLEQQPSAWWVKLTERFPAIIIVTTSPSRTEKIKEQIKAENVHGLEFVVYELEQIKQECEDGCR